MRKKKLYDQTLDPVSQELNVEVDEQTSPYPGEFHICERLRLVNPIDSLHAFQFHD